MSLAVHITSIGRDTSHDTLISLNQASKKANQKIKVYLALQNDFFIDIEKLSNINLKVFFQNTKNASKGKNKTVTNSNEENLLFVDDDIVVDENWIIRMEKALDRHQLVFGKTLPYLPERNPEKIVFCCFQKKWGGELPKKFANIGLRLVSVIIWQSVERFLKKLDFLKHGWAQDQLVEMVLMQNLLYDAF